MAQSWGADVGWVCREENGKRWTESIICNFNNIVPRKFKSIPLKDLALYSNWLYKSKRFFDLMEEN
jgi:hypothetical protein